MSNDQLSKLNDMISNMNNMNVCDAACQKKKKVDRLRIQYNAARNRKANAPAEIEARVEAQKAAIASMKEEVTAEEKIACSIENPDDCVSCGS